MGPSEILLIVIILMVVLFGAGLLLRITRTNERSSLSGSSDLASVYARLSRVEQKVDRILRQLEMGEASESPSSDFASEFPSRIPDGVLEPLMRGNKIEAIRVYREATGVGLKEAKDAVEAIEADQKGSRG